MTAVQFYAVVAGPNFKIAQKQNEMKIKKLNEMEMRNEELSHPQFEYFRGQSAQVALYNIFRK